MSDQGYVKTKINKKILIALSVLTVVAIILAIVIPTTTSKIDDWPNSITKKSVNEVEESIDNGEDFYLYIGLDIDEVSETFSDSTGVYANSGFFIDGRDTSTSFQSNNGGLVQFANLGISNVYALTGGEIDQVSNYSSDVYKYLIDNNGQKTSTNKTIDKDNFIWVKSSGNPNTGNAYISEAILPKNYEELYSPTPSKIDSASQANNYMVENLEIGTCTKGSENVKDVPLFNSNSDCYTSNETTYTDDVILTTFNNNFNSSLAMGSYYSSVAPQVIKFGERPDGTYGIEFTTMFISSTLQVDSYVALDNYFNNGNYVLENNDSLKSWEITLIVLGSMAFVLLTAYGSYFIYERYYKG